MGERLGVALFGCGGYGRALAAAVRAVAELELVGAADPDPERVARVGAPRTWTSLEAALADRAVGAVLLATPNHLHHRQALQVVGAGRHLFVEKPLTTVHAQGVEVLAAALANRVTLVVGHNLEFLSPLDALRRQLAATRVTGAAWRFSRALGGVGGEGAWRFDRDACPGGPLLQLGIHGVGILLDLFGPPREVTGRVHARDGGGGVLDGELRWRGSGGIPLAVRADYRGEEEFMALRVETGEGVHTLGTGYTEGPEGRVGWDLDAAFHLSRVALLRRFRAAAADGAPGNGAHALAALEVVGAIGEGILPT